MKGFVRILEMILASVIILGSLTYFFTSYVKPSSWPKSEIQIEGYDVLKSLDETNELRTFIMKNNISGFYDRLYGLLPSTVNFLIEVDGLPKPLIKIACNCTQSEKDKLQKMLHTTYSLSQPVHFKGMKIRFQILNETSLDEILKHDEQWNDIDVITFFRFQDLSSYERRIQKYLERGKGLILVSDIDSSDLNSFYSKIFNLSWSSSATAVVENYSFSDGQRFKERLEDYFVHLPVRIRTYNNNGGQFYIQGIEYSINTYENSTGDYAVFNSDYYKKGDTFLVNGYPILVADVNASPVLENDTYVDLIIQDKNYTFILTNPSGLNKINVNEKTVIKTNDGKYSGAQINYYVSKYGNGRTLWIKNYNENYTDIDQLFRSLVIQVAGEKYILSTDVFDAWYKKRMLENVKTFVKVHYLVSGIGELQPFYVDLILWYVYQ